jgi:hypothetical protein
VKAPGQRQKRRSKPGGALLPGFCSGGPAGSVAVRVLRVTVAACADGQVGLVITFAARLW